MSPGNERPDSGSRGARDLVRGRPVAAFYALLLMLTWPPMVIWGGSPVIYVLLAILGPSTCSLIVVAVAGGRSSVLSQLRSVLAWRAPVWAWLYASVGNGLLVAGSAVLAVLIFGNGELNWQIGAIAVTLMLNLVLLLLVPALVEEIGWRGLALPRLQERLGPVRASLAVGLLWAVWHYPLWIVQDGGIAASMLWITLGMIGASFAYTWLFNIGGGSVLTAIVLHAGENAWTGNAFDILFETEHGLAYVARQLAAIGIAVVLVVATRGRLGATNRPRRPR